MSSFSFVSLLSLSLSASQRLSGYVAFLPSIRSRSPDSGLPWLSANGDGKLRLGGLLNSISPLVEDNKLGNIKRALKVRSCSGKAGYREGGKTMGKFSEFYRRSMVTKKNSGLLPIRSKSPLERHLLLQSGKVQKRWRKNDGRLGVAQKQTIRIFPRARLRWNTKHAIHSFRRMFLVLIKYNPVLQTP